VIDFVLGLKLPLDDVGDGPFRGLHDQPIVRGRRGEAEELRLLAAVLVDVLHEGAKYGTILRKLDVLGTLDLAGIPQDWKPSPRLLPQPYIYRL